MNEEMTYESAVGRLDEIISRLDSGEAQLRETLDLCAEAKTLIEFCATELSAVDQGLKELKLDELAKSLAPVQATATTEGPGLEPEPDPVQEQGSVPGEDEIPF